MILFGGIIGDLVIDSLNIWIGDLMKKNDLIKMLQNIEGNPDIIFYNGFVDDWQHIDEPEEIELCRYSLEQQLKYINLERLRYNKKPITKDQIIEREDWELLSNYNSRAEDRKTCIILKSIRRGRTYEDRVGSIRY